MRMNDRLQQHLILSTTLKIDTYLNHINYFHIELSAMQLYRRINYNVL